MHRTLFRSLATATAVTGLLLIGNGITTAHDDQDNVVGALGVNAAVNGPGIVVRNSYRVEVDFVPVNTRANLVVDVGLLSPMFSNV